MTLTQHFLRLLSVFPAPEGKPKLPRLSSEERRKAERQAGRARRRKAEQGKETRADVLQEVQRG